MNYGFLIFGELDRVRLASALGSLFSLPAEAVDVGDEEQVDRNWEAPISCNVMRLAGEPRSSLDIYVADNVESVPPVAVAAAWLAARLAALVGYESVPEPPSAYWLVEPDGRRTRARIYQLDRIEPAELRVDAVERFVAALPGVPVEPLPEVIHSYQMPTPLTDRLGMTGKVSYQLGAWEAMIARLEAGWPPDGWYPAAFYRDDLRTRDELARVREPEVVRALTELDQRFTTATWDDAGTALAAELPDAGGSGWWWRRISHPVPWRDMPGR